MMIIPEAFVGLTLAELKEHEKAAAENGTYGAIPYNKMIRRMVALKAKIVPRFL